MSDDLFENWRSSRSKENPSPGFVDRVMDSIATAPIEAMPASTGGPALRSRWPSGIRMGLVAAAVAVALFRASELLSVFSATGLEVETRNHLALQESQDDN